MGAEEPVDTHPVPSRVGPGSQVNGILLQAPNAVGQRCSRCLTQFCPQAMLSPFHKGGTCWDPPREIWLQHPRSPSYPRLLRSRRSPGGRVARPSTRASQPPTGQTPALEYGVPSHGNMRWSVLVGTIHRLGICWQMAGGSLRTFTMGHSPGWGP